MGHSLCGGGPFFIAVVLLVLCAAAGQMNEMRFRKGWYCVLI